MHVLIFGWRSFGVLVPVIFLLTLVATELTTDAIGGPGYYSRHELPKKLGCALTAGLIWSVGKWLNRPTGTQSALDRQTGHEIGPPARHTFLHIPKQPWSFGVVALAVCMWFT
jgi:hypothetical protein